LGLGFPLWELGTNRVPSPRSIGIIGLERKCDLIYGAQSLTGKILMSKNLQAKILLAEAQNGTMRVSAYRRCLDYDYAIYFWAQGQMSQGGCGKVKMSRQCRKELGEWGDIMEINRELPVRTQDFPICPDIFPCRRCKLGVLR